MKLGLSARFWIIVLAATLLCMVLGFFAWRQQATGVDQLADLSGQTIHEASVRSEQRRALTMAQLIADSLINPLYYFDLVTIGEVTGSALAQPDVSYALVYDADGRILHDGTRGIERFGQRMGDALAAEAITARTPVLQTGEDVIDAAVPVWLGRERIGGVRIGISMRTPALFEREAVMAVERHGKAIQKQTIGIALLLVGCLLVLLAFTGLIISRNLVRPVQRLAEAARRIAQGDYQVDVPASGRHDEIGELEYAFARMRESVEQHDKDIRRIAYGDSLTGFPNRAAFRETLNLRVEVASRMGTQLALLFIDLDDFKRINDTLGHDAGDEALIAFGARIRRAAEMFMPGQVDLARFGGDEFVAILSSQVVEEPAARLAHALLAELRHPLSLGGQSIVLAASIGITVYPRDGDAPTILLKNADIAMYRAKFDGKNCFRFYTQAMETEMGQQLQLEQDIRLALERKEFSVVYQPILSTFQRKIIGAEALVRWHHPQRGVMMPDQFLPVAEESGLISEIGRFVLRTACQDAASWTGAGRDCFVSVNVSSRQLKRGDLPDVVEQALHQSGLPAQRLHLELTETTVFGNETEAIAASRRLRASGVKFWLDDFGTGSSGLSHLRRVPVDGVKIDRSFVDDMLEDPDASALTAAIIAMAHSLGVVVTAEGVETEGQYEALRARGCDNVQGFLLGRPIINAELAAQFSAAV